MSKSTKDMLSLMSESHGTAAQLSPQTMVSFDLISDPEVKILFENNAKKVNELGAHFLSIDCNDWFERLSKLPLERLKLIISQIESTKRLTTELADNWLAPLSFLETTKMEYLNLLISKCPQVIPIIKNLHQLRSSIISLLFIDTDKLNLLLLHHAEAIELSHALLNEYAQPFEELMNRPIDKLQLLFSYCPNVIDLLKNLERYHYIESFNSLINLDEQTFESLCNYHQQAIAIMNSLYERGVLRPLDYLCQLGSDRMLAIFLDVDNCVLRLRDGYDLKNPELPPKSHAEMVMESMELALEHFGNLTSYMSPC